MPAKKKTKTWVEKQLSTAKKNAAKEVSSYAATKAKKGMESKINTHKDAKNRSVSKLRLKKAAALKKSKVDGMTGAGVSVGSEKKRITRKLVDNDVIVQAMKRAVNKTKAKKKKK